ncbi:hypothetical protein SAMN05421771_3244 [Granulicella pectinivorans]|uniref:Uncharacterized protein n=1 Tax=Granulicella pectinivorans TaxID=474950 RepID=A0A1I6MPW1_9BACT|nr:hypothetical protein [Granulicella pectinivorans]SFS17732.1 hypothetical protein SAMN05421771_3244 [Granulicella pectinivorans]
MPDHTSANSKPEQAVMPWYIAAGDDGLHKDCIMVAVMNGPEIQTISLHLAALPEAD